MSWTFSPNTVNDSHHILNLTYGLPPESTSGWNFSQVSFELGSNSYTYPSDTLPYVFTGVGKVTAISLQPRAIQLTLENENRTGNEQTLSISLTVSNSQGGRHTSPDPQVILDPR